MCAMDNQSLYFFAILPPDELAEKLDAIRVEVSEKYLCYAALKPPVHITLYPPFKDVNIEKRFSLMSSWIQRQPIFDIQLKDFNFFKNREHPVVYADVVKNLQLQQLQAGLKRYLRRFVPTTKESYSFKPHITLGYRDIKPEVFPDIIRDFSKRTFEASFTADTVYLLKHDGKKWNILFGFKMGTAATAQNYTQGSLFD
ncbi:MAG: 2'-5' RNA ligase family protein [Sphingobacteriales bacterium]|nr:MAG: 2'-5' RNA ligase family protein [Sphingobacteriales bacterium]